MFYQMVIYWREEGSIDGRVYVVRLEELGDPRYRARRTPTRFALRCCEQTWKISIRRYRAVP